MRSRAPKKQKDETPSGRKTHPVPVKHPERDDAPMHYTPHLSSTESEGRRNQPSNPSPKKTKRRHTAKHLAETKKQEEMGALAPFSTE